MSCNNVNEAENIFIISNKYTQSNKRNSHLYQGKHAVNIIMHICIVSCHERFISACGMLAVSLKQDEIHITKFAY